MSIHALAVFANLPDYVLSEVFDSYLYPGNELSNEIEYDDIYADCTPRARRQGDFARAILPASRRFYDIGIRVLWRCVVVRDSTSLRAIADRTGVGGFRIGPAGLAGLIRRFELRLPRAYDPALVQEVLERTQDLHVLHVRNYSLRSGRGYRPSPLHLLRPLGRALRRVQRVQFDTELVVPSGGDIMDVLFTNSHMKTLRVGHFAPLHPTPLPWEPPSPKLLTSHLTTLSLGSVAPLGRPKANPSISSFLSALVDHVALPHLKVLDIFEECDFLHSFLRVYGFQLDRLAYAAPRRGQNTSVDEWIDDCPNLEELVWVMRGWFPELPPADGRDNISKVAIYYIKDASENKWDCLDQLQEAVGVFYGDAYGGLAALEVVVRGQRVPDYGDCDWLDEAVDTVQVMSGNDGWAVDVGLGD